MTANPSRGHSGNNEEITRLVLEHRRVIFAYIMTQAPSYHDAEDIFQETCLTICSKYGEFEAGTNFRAWAMSIARHKVLSNYQEQDRKKKMVQLTEDIADMLADDRIWYEAENPMEEALAALRVCLTRVKGKNRLLVLKHYGEGLSCQATAEAIGWSANAVRVALSRLRGSLRKCVRSRLSAAERREGGTRHE